MYVFVCVYVQEINVPYVIAKDSYVKYNCHHLAISPEDYTFLMFINSITRYSVVIIAHAHEPLHLNFPTSCIILSALVL